MDKILQTKVLIIGAGPAGTSCGIRLNNLGVDCILVDRKPFPRTKLCAGLLTFKGEQVLRYLLNGTDYDDFLIETVSSKEDTFRYYDGVDKLLAECKSPSPVLLLDRTKSDYWMARHFLKLGGKFYDDCSVQSIDFKNHLATFPSFKVKYDYLVAADGANSTVERMLATTFPEFTRRSSGILCCEVNIDKQDLNIDGINTYYNVVPNTYAWAFSKGNTSSIGFGIIGKVENELDARNVMSDFLNKLGAKNIERYKMKFAMMNYDFTKNHSFQDVLFVGEAAGLVDPFTGEGISFALKSGLDAAEAINTDSNDVDEAYKNKLREITSYLEDGAKRQKYLYGNKRMLQYYLKSLNNNTEIFSSFFESCMLNAFARFQR